MTTPRWFLFASGLLLLNTLLVMAAGYRHHAAADEPNRAPTMTASPTSSGASADLDPPSLAPSATSTEGAPSSTKDPQAQLDALPVPAQLPDPPELVDLEALKNDPGFQEFRRLFEQAEESWGSEPPLLAPRSEDDESQAEATPRDGSRRDQLRKGQLRKGQLRVGNSSASYFQALDQRMETVEALCAVARSLALQAAEQEEKGSLRQSQELLRMTTQLRDMAAKLLVSEM